MDHRERILTAIEHEEPDRVPTALWGSAYGLTDPLYRDLLSHLNLGQPVDPFRARLGHTVNHYDERVLEALGTDTRYVWLGFSDLAGPPEEGGLDAWGVGWKKTGLYASATQHPLKDATAEEVARYDWPDVEAYVRRDELRERARRLKQETDYAVVGRAADSYGLLERSSSLRGTEQFLLDLAMDEAFAEALIEQVADVLYRLLDIYLDAAGPYLDILELPGDDYAAEHPLISPQMFDRFFAPHWRRLIGLIREAAPDCKVLFHSDGNMEPFLGRLIDLGVDVFHPLEPMPNVDMAEIKQTYGDRLCFLGAVDIKQSMQGDPDRVEAEARQRIRTLAPGGGYILAPANHLQPDVPAENVVALYRAAHEWGRYPLELD
jgi:uroporphyrinogen decarboxylase